LRPRLEALEDRTLLSSYSAAGVSDLIADINAANKAGGTNAITLAAASTSPYVLTAVDNTTNGANGLPVIGGKYGDNLTIIGNGDTIERSTAALTPAFRLFDVASGSSLTLQNVTLQNGLASGSGSAADGGAIYNQGTLTLTGATVQNNAVVGSNGAAGLITWQKNQSNQINGQAGGDAAGGGIWSSGSLTLQGGTILQANQAIGGQGGAAGAYLRSGSVSVPGKGGAGGGGFGGGLYQASGSVNGTNATLVSNTAAGGAGGNGYEFLGGTFVGGYYSAGIGGSGAGGGLFTAGGTLNLSSVSVQSNRAQGGVGGGFTYSFLDVPGTGGVGYGSGIYIAGGTVTLATINLLSNDAWGGQGGDGGNGTGGSGGNAYGGGLYVGGGSVTLTNSTMTQNGALGGDDGRGGGIPPPSYGFGGGIYIASTGTLYLDSFTVANTINNFVKGSASDYSASDIDGTYILS
jgi:hypothetical protein